MASVELNHVDKVYEGNIKAVDNFNLQISDQEFVVLVGPSGCGKTTTLRMIAGLEEVTGGTICIGGRVVNDVAPKDRDIAMVFQNYALYPHMSVYENMAFGLMMRSMSKDVVRSKVHDAADLLGITHLLERLPKQLSGGQRQRVALGRAIVRDPRCFLFDEPLSNLDARLRVEMRAELKRLHLNLKCTTVYVTHDQEEAITLGDRLVVMKDGVVQQCDGALDIYHKPANRFVAGFLGSPPMNFTEGDLVEISSTLYFDEGSARLRLTDEQAATLRCHPRKRVVFGIRPEAICDENHAHFPQMENAADAIVSLVQPLGAKMDVHLTTPSGNQWVAHMDAFQGVAVAQSMRLRIDMRHAHFFDTGEGEINLMQGNEFNQRAIS